MEDKDFIIYEGAEGTFNPLGTYNSVPRNVDDMFTAFSTNNSTKITLYFHGGLVNENNGRESAYRIAEHILDAGNAPVCFVWKTGMLETIQTNLGSIGGTTLFKKLLSVLIKTIAKKLGFNELDGRGAGTILTDAEINTELNKDYPFENYIRINLEQSVRAVEILTQLPEQDYELEQQLYPDLNRMIRADPDFIQAINSTAFLSPDGPAIGTRGILSLGLFIKSVTTIAFKVVKRFLQKRDHDFYPTIIEEILRQFYIAEIGATVWNDMKIKAEQMWEDNAGRNGLNLHAGRYFLDKLVAYSATQPELQINLVGHSAGSIVICNLLKYASSNYPNLKFNNVIFMAPACRIDLFSAEVVNQPQRFNKFRSFTMTDANEKKDILVPLLYTHSLLYLISGILEQNGQGFDEYILGMERHISGTPPYDKDSVLLNVHNYLYSGDSNKLCLSVTNPDLPGLSTHALHHGDFHDDPPTVASTEFIIKL